MIRQIAMSLLVLTLLSVVPTFATPGGPGAVYAMTNALEGNEIAAYSRAHDGTLTLDGYYATGGLGVGATTEPVDALGSSAPLILSPNQRWLLAVNAGSDEISVFRVRPHGLLLVDVVPSGGLHPASLTLHGDLLYVLNSGGEGNITGFELRHDGRLVPIAGSTRSLDVGGTNPPFFLVSPAQVGFDPRGDFLVVTIKGTDEIRVYPVDFEGLPSAEPVTTISHGSTPFGFDFDQRGRLIVAEPFGNASPGVPNTSAASLYRIRRDGSLDLLSASVENGQTASCWLVSTGRYAYLTNNATDNVSGYRIGRDGTLSLLDQDGVAGLTGHAPVDAALTPNGRFLYNVDAGSGTISMFRIKANGSLISLGEVGGLPEEEGAVGIVAR